LEFVEREKKKGGKEPSKKSGEAELRGNLTTRNKLGKNRARNPRGGELGEKG